MVYVLIFLHFVNTDHLKYYQIKTFSTLEECKAQAEEADIMVTHSSMTVTCLQIANQ